MYEQFAKDVIMDGVRGREENLLFGILAAAVAAAMGAGIWLGIVVGIGLHVEYAVPIGMGVLVGLAVRQIGNGTGMLFGIIGVVFTLIGCLGGEILTAVQPLTTPQHDLYNILTTVDLTQVLSRILDKTDPIMYLIYAIGAFVAYRFSIRE